MQSLLLQTNPEPSTEFKRTLRSTGHIIRGFTVQAYARILLARRKTEQDHATGSGRVEQEDTGSVLNCSIRNISRNMFQLHFILPFLLNLLETLVINRIFPPDRSYSRHASWSPPLPSSTFLSRPIKREWKRRSDSLSLLSLYALLVRPSKRKLNNY